MPEEWQGSTLPAKDQKAQQLNTHFDKFAPDHLSSSCAVTLCHSSLQKFSSLEGKIHEQVTTLTYYSSEHSTNKTTCKDAKCRISLKLISASPSATQLPKVSGRGSKIKCCHSFLSQRQKSEAILGSSATTGRGKEREHWDQQLRSQALA